MFTKRFSYHFGNLFYTVLINFDILHSCFIYKNNIFFLIRHYGGGTICLRESCIHGIFFFFKILLKLKIETLRLHIRANVGMHQVMIFKIVLWVPIQIKFYVNQFYTKISFCNKASGFKFFFSSVNFNSILQNMVLGRTSLCKISMK